MTDLAVMRAYLRAVDGDFSSLADMIEKGTPLDPQTRKFLAAYLRGNLPRSRGNSRTLAARLRDMEVLRQVEYFAQQEIMGAKVAAENGLKYRPMGGARAYLERHPDLAPDTLKSILARARRERAIRVNKRSQSSP